MERAAIRQSIAHVALVLRDHDEAIAFWRDYHEMVDRGIRFVRPPSEQPYGVVAAFEDLHGNRWDLIQYAEDQPYAQT